MTVLGQCPYCKKLLQQLRAVEKEVTTEKSGLAVSLIVLTCPDIGCRKVLGAVQSPRRRPREKEA